MIEKIDFQTKCEDDVILKGILLKPINPKAIVQFNGGTAAKKEFYLPFLMYLAENNYLCCLWDYRGSGDSANGHLKNCNYIFRDYGLKDMPAIKKYLQDNYPHLPLLLFVHSAGGQQIGFMEGLEDYKGMVGFAVSTGYLPNMPLLYRLKSYSFFYLFTPLSNMIFGFLNAKAFGIMENLPKNVVAEWRNWCTKESYCFDKKFANKTVPIKNFKRIPFPIHIFWTPDDPISNEKNIKNFWVNIKSKKSVSFQVLKPSVFGIQKIEHFGFFKRKMKEKLWILGLNKLNEFLEKSTHIQGIGIKSKENEQ